MRVDDPGLGPFDPRSIRLRIVAAFLAAVVSMVAALGWLITQQQEVQGDLEVVTEGYLPLAAKVAILRRDLERVRRDLNRLLRDRPRPLSGDTSTAQIYTEEVQENLALARVPAEGLLRRTLDAEEKAAVAKVLAYLDSIGGLFEEYERDSAAFLQLVEAGAAQRAQSTLRGPLRNTSRRLEEEFDKLDRTVTNRVEALAAQTEARQARAIRVAAALVGVALVAGGFLLLAVLVALRPVAELTAEAQRLAAGERSGRVKVSGDDEIGRLAAAFNVMAEAIEERDRSLHDRAAELQRLSRYLGSVVDSLEDGLVVVEQGVVTLTNPAAARRWGAEEEARPPAILDDVMRPGTHELVAGATVHAVRSVPFGERGVVTVLTDVTDQVRAQERLARSERLALVGQMLAQITHEVRNPLNALSLNAELLGDELVKLDPEHGTEAHDILGMVAGEVDRLTDLTGHYLQLARRPRAELAAAEVSDLVHEVVRLVEPELAAAGVAITANTTALGPQLVDANQLRQALLNVVRNGVEAGAHHLTLTLDRVEDEVRLTLADDGPGMDADTAAAATDPFWTTKASGTGLGLAITRQILEDHDGVVRIAAGEGGGTVVCLAWPWRGV